MTSPEEVRAMYDALTEGERLATGLMVRPVRKNKCWKPIREQIKAYALEKKSFSLRELKEAGIIDEKVTGPDFRKNAVKKIDILNEQKGVLPKNASIYHLHGHARRVDVEAEAVFDEPSSEAAIYLVNTVLNGSIGSINIKDKMTPKQFTFMGNKASMKKFEPLVKDEAGKDGWRFGSRPFQATKKEE